MDQNSKVLRGSTDRFGYQWSNYTEIMDESRDQLQRWLGSTPLSSFKEKSVMDVGCGMGRNPYWFATAGASRVLGVDADDGTVNAARKNLAHVPNTEVKKISVFDLDPNVVGQFDAVTCIGVLHHLADPEDALKKMWACVKPGGDLILWCYGKKGNQLLLPIIQTLRFFGSRLPIAITDMMAWVITAFAWPFFQLMPFRTEYYQNLKKLSFRNIKLIILDQMIPRIAHYWTEEDMKRLTAPLGGSAFIEFVQGNSWTARVTKKN